jgi:hypothetical protein
MKLFSAAATVVSCLETVDAKKGGVRTVMDSPTSSEVSNEGDAGVADAMGDGNSDRDILLTKKGLKSGQTKLTAKSSAGPTDEDSASADGVSASADGSASAGAGYDSESDTPIAELRAEKEEQERLDKSAVKLEDMTEEQRAHHEKVR